MTYFVTGVLFNWSNRTSCSSLFQYWKCTMYNHMKRIPTSNHRYFVTFLTVGPWWSAGTVLPVTSQQSLNSTVFVFYRLLLSSGSTFVDIRLQKDGPWNLKRDTKEGHRRHFDQKKIILFLYIILIKAHSHLFLQRLRSGCDTAWRVESSWSASTFIDFMSLYIACCCCSVAALNGTWYAVGLSLFPPRCRWREKYLSNGSWKNTSLRRYLTPGILNNLGG